MVKAQMIIQPEMEEAFLKDGNDNEQNPNLDKGIRLTQSKNNSTDNNDASNDDNDNEVQNGYNASIQQIIHMNMELVKAAQELAKRNTVTRAADMMTFISEQHPIFFDGKDGDPFKLENWIRQFEKIFSIFMCPEEIRVDQAAFYLTGSADIWWSNNEERLRKMECYVGENGEKVLVPFTWDDFKRVLRAEFFPKHVRKEKWMEFDNLKQGTLSVHEYYQRFQELAHVVPEMVPSTEEAKAWKFEHNLDIEIQLRLGGENFATLSAVYERACNIERIMRIINEKKALVGEKRKGAHFNNLQGFHKKGNFNN